MPRPQPDPAPPRAGWPRPGPRCGPTSPRSRRPNGFAPSTGRWPTGSPPPRPRERRAARSAPNPAHTPAPFAHQVRPRHLDRLAVAYVRQSAPQQVVGHRGSADLPYRLRRRAVEYGWAEPRLLQGRLNKARRGEAFSLVPIGYVRTADGGIALDPDEQARAAVRLVFQKVAELGSVRKARAFLIAHDIRLGVRS
jgi:hypothetical protein